MSKHFNITYCITFSGNGRAEKTKVITSQMIRDKILHMLEEYIKRGYIETFAVSAQLDNITKDTTIHGFKRGEVK